MMTNEDKRATAWFLFGGGWFGIVAVGVTCLFLWGCPQYEVYKQGLQGEARLREAESSRQIVVEGAKAKKDAAHMLAAAEVERAKGIAEANKIVGDSLKNNTEYLTYLWIQELSSNP